MSTATEPVVVMAVPESTPCRCRHTAGTHLHYRPGTDCASCTCPQFRPASRNRIWVRLGRGLKRTGRRDRRPTHQHRPDGLTALLDAVLTRGTTRTHDEDEVTRWTSSREASPSPS